MFSPFESHRDGTFVIVIVDRLPEGVRSGSDFWVRLPGILLTTRNGFLKTFYGDSSFEGPRDFTSKSHVLILDVR